jgi:hypothetical protein
VTCPNVIIQGDRASQNEAPRPGAASPLCAQRSEGRRAKCWATWIVCGRVAALICCSQDRVDYGDRPSSRVA